MLKKRILAVVLVAVVSLAFVGCDKNPKIAVSTESLTFDGSQNTLTFQVWNAGKGTLEFTVASDVAWLDVTPAEGTSVSASDKKTVTVDLTAEALKANSLDGSIVVSAQIDGAEATATVAVVKGQNLFTANYTAGVPLSEKTLTFVPGAGLSGYTLDVEDNGGVLHEDPAGGTEIDFLTEGDPAEIVPSNAIPFYGTEYTSVFVSSKGAVKFEMPGTPSADPIADHFADAGVTGLSSADALSGGTVSYKEDPLKLSVTYQDVPLAAKQDCLVTLQFCLFFDGIIMVGYQDLACVEAGLVGLSDGLGAPQTLVNSNLETDYNTSGMVAK